MASKMISLFCFTLMALTSSAMCAQLIDSCFRGTTVCSILSSCHDVEPGWVKVIGSSCAEYDCVWERPGTKCGVTSTGSSCGSKFVMSVCNESGGNQCSCSQGGCTQFHYTNQDAFSFGSTAPILPAPEESYISGRLAEAAEQGVVPLVASLWSRLARARSLSFSASVEIWRSAQLSSTGSELSGTGTFRYWEQGNSSRASVDIPLALELYPISEVAVNETMLQTLFQDEKLLTLTGADSRRLGLPMPNPLFALFKSLGISDDSLCTNCELRLRDFKDAPHPAVIAVGRDGVARQQTKAGRNFDRDVDFEVTQLTSSITLLERANGKPSKRMTFRGLDHREGSGGLPTSVEIVWLSSEDDSTPLQRIAYTFDLVQFDQEIPASMFKLSWDGLRQIYDLDARKFAHRVKAAP